MPAGTLAHEALAPDQSSGVQVTTLAAVPVQAAVHLYSHELRPPGIVRGEC